MPTKYTPLSAISISPPSPDHKPPSYEISSLYSAPASAASSSSTVNLLPLESGAVEFHAPDRTTLLLECVYVWRNARFLFVTLALQQSLTLSCVFVVGRLGRDELGGASLAVMTVFITGFAPVRGFSAALDTLCGQAFGSHQYALVGLFTQRMLSMLLLLLLPIALLWFYSTSLFSLVLDEQVSRLAGLYLRISIIGLPGYASYEAGKSFLQSQGNFWGGSYVLLLTAPLNLFLNWLFVWGLGWGFVGAPIAMVCTQIAQPLSLFLYIRYVSGLQCWSGFTWRALKDWGPILKLTLPTWLMLQAEYTAFQIPTLASAFISSSHLATAAILTNIISLVFQLPAAVANTSATRISHYIGDSRVLSARITSHAALLNGTLLGCFNAFIVYTARYYIPRLFTAEEDVIALFNTELQVILVLIIFDATNGVAAGIMRGLGEQRIGGWISVAAFYGAGLPVGFSSAFWGGWKLRGLFAGIDVALGVQGATCVGYVYWWKRDWAGAVEAARKRNANG